MAPTQSAAKVVISTREHGGDRQREACHLHRQREGIGAEAIEHAVAERDHAGVADQQVERGRKQRHGAQADDEILEGGAAMQNGIASTTIRRDGGDQPHRATREGAS